LQPFLLLLSPFADALGLLSQSVSLSDCSVTICRAISLLE
jgi:hypothetical protein